MCLEMCGIDHQPIGLPALGGKRGEDAVEHAQAAPANEPVVDGLVRAVTGRRISPAQPVPDHEDDAADDPAIIDPRDAMRQWKIRLDPTHLRLAQQPQIRQSQRLLSAAIESTEGHLRKRFNRS